MTALDLATLLAMPDDALVPVRWVREILASLEEQGDDGGLGDTVEQFAVRADRAPSTVRTWCADGRLPGARKLRGREWRIPRSALRALLDGDEPPERERGVKRLDVPRGGLSAWRDAR